jgi:hypothetical protein
VSRGWSLSLRVALSLVRSGQNKGVDELLSQFNHLSSSLTIAEDAVQDLHKKLAAERLEGKRRHASLVDELTRCLQAKDSAYHLLQNIDNSTVQSGNLLEASTSNDSGVVLNVSRLVNQSVFKYVSA